MEQHRDFHHTDHILLILHHSRHHTDHAFRCAMLDHCRGRDRAPVLVGPGEDQCIVAAAEHAEGLVVDYTP